MKRNQLLVGPRIGQAIFLGLVLGSVYVQLDDSEFAAKIGLILFAVIQVAFGNMAEVPTAIESKNTVYKQVDAGFYPSSSYVVSSAIVHFPLAIVESFIFGSLLYWIAGYVNNAARYFFFILIMLATNLAMSTFFRSITYLSANQDVAQMTAGPITVICLLFGGFLLTADKVPSYLIWLYWLSPFSWAVKSISQSEFSDPHYDRLITNADGELQRAGDVFLKAWEISTDFAYRWAGFGYLISFFGFWLIISALCIKYKRFELSRGTSRLKVDDEEGVQSMTSNRCINTAIAIDQHASSTASSLPFQPAILAFNNLKYTVTIEENKVKRDKVLLQGVSGYARPGTITALMGVSGAGKTTLLDLLAGRKTSGKIEGEILVNGHLLDRLTFSRLSGYVEQRDLHNPTSTVRETLMFAAKLRLPDTVTNEQREDFVDEIMRLLELDLIADRLIGDEVISGLSPGQLKRVTIGVELVCNPPILFLDEPTSGLDSRAAQIVMRVVKRIAMTGRSIICTIHQPSAEIFYYFDRLLLLQSGGYEVYFGDLGEEGELLVNYFTSKQENLSKPDRYNPATWMLDVIGAGTGTDNNTDNNNDDDNNTDKKKIDFHQQWIESDLYKQSQMETQSALKPNDQVHLPTFDSTYARNYLYQYLTVQHRAFISHWRNTEYNFSRFSILSFLGVAFGLVYLGINDNDQPGVQSKIAAIFMGSAFCGVIFSASGLPILCRFRAIFYRERTSSTYSPWIYAITSSLLELPYVFVGSFLFVISYYFMLGFEYNADLFFRFFAAHYLTSLCFMYLGQLFAVAFPDVIVANIFQGLIFTLLFLFGGVFINPPSIPAGWKWFYYLNPVSKAVIALAIPQFSCQGNNCPTIQVVTPDGNFVQDRFSYVLSVLETSSDSYDV